ncbi:hypothetical protein JW916_10280 [Candidatus Sumerlaeota bacterium]|nr:hypothetical protein [Candidatus Sumerlaeota bacterium]
MKKTYCIAAIFAVLLHCMLAENVQALWEGTHFATSNGQVWKHHPTQVLLNTGCSLLSLEFDPSPSGKLMYVERMDRTQRPVSGSRAIQGRLDERWKQFDPNEIALKLHVCDEKGNDLAVVPIPETYDQFYFFGRFYGENFVGLQNYARGMGKVQETIVDLATGAIYAWEIPAGTGEPNFPETGLTAFASPDGRHIARLISRRDGSSVLAIDAVQVYPFHAPCVPDPSMTPSEFRSLLDATRDWVESHPGPHWLHPGRMSPDSTESPWSPDGRSLALFAPHGEVDAQTTPTLDVRVFDVERALAGGDVSTYCESVSTGLPKTLLYANWGEERDDRPTIEWGEPVERSETEGALPSEPTGSDTRTTSTQTATPRLREFAVESTAAAVRTFAVSFDEVVTE